MKQIKSILKFILPKGVITKLNIIKNVIKNDSKTNTLISGVLLNPYNIQNGLITNFTCNFMEESRFLDAYNLGIETGALRHHPGDLYWRAYVACWAAYKAKELPGDFVECGVNLGFLSRVITDYVGFQNLDKKFYLIDTFSGFPLETMGEEQREHLTPQVTSEYKECYEEVKATFKEFPNVIIVRGKVPDVLASIESDKIAFISLDMNNADAEIAAAEYFWDKIVSGGVILLDDYGHPMSIFHRKKFDEFCEKRKVKVLTLPNGQGLIFKN